MERKNKIILSEIIKECSGGLIKGLKTLQERRKITRSHRKFRITGRRTRCNCMKDMEITKNR
jgi:hypothetical protein